jgi:hypothetical protein
VEKARQMVSQAGGPHPEKGQFGEQRNPAADAILKRSIRHPQRNPAQDAEAHRQARQTRQFAAPSGQQVTTYNHDNSSEPADNQVTVTDDQGSNTLSQSGADRYLRERYGIPYSHSDFY